MTRMPTRPVSMTTAMRELNGYMSTMICRTHCMVHPRKHRSDPDFPTPMSTCAKFASGNQDLNPFPWSFLLSTVLFFATATAVAQTSEATDPSASFGIGRPATAAEIARWNLDVMPNGTGLPEGQGTAAQGASLYATQCANCHGEDGQKGRDWLVGRQPDDSFPFGAESGHRRTVGNYWPFATTLFDYIRRAMPPNAAGSLGDDQVYALTAYLLHLNEIIDADTVMNAESLAQVRMPARDRFVPDNRRGGAEVR